MTILLTMIEFIVITKLMKQPVLEQARIAFSPGNRKAAWLSVPGGALIPLATHLNAHSAETVNLALAAGGLVYSGLTVFGWMHQTFALGAVTRWERAGAVLKALGFVVISEGTLVHAPHPVLSWVVVTLLGVANAIALHASMVQAAELWRKKAREAERATAKRERALRVIKVEPKQRVRAGRQLKSVGGKK